MRITKTEILHHLKHAQGDLQAVQTGEKVPSELRQVLQEYILGLQYLMEDLNEFYPDLEERDGETV